MHPFYCVRQNPTDFVSHKSSRWRWDFADWISKLVDNYFSISVNPAGRIYSQYTKHNITHAHSSSSACSSFSPPLFPCWYHEDFTCMRARGKLIGNVNTGFQRQLFANQCHIVKVTDFPNSSIPMQCFCRLLPHQLHKQEVLLLDKLGFHQVIIWQQGMCSLEYLHWVGRLTQAI